MRLRRWSKLGVSCLFALATAVTGVGPCTGAESATFQTVAPFAFLLDADTGSVLFEKKADEPMAPASTAKIMTAEVVFHELKGGRLKLDDRFVVSEHAWRDGGARSGGSSSFLAVTSSVRVEDLLRGLIIQSGNDAAIALGEGVAGSDEAFARRMNDRAREIGLEHSRFANPWGGADPAQKVTARDMARLARYIIQTYPEFYGIFGEKEFTWNKIRQLNRNPLLTMGLGADGLKTGDIADSGFGLVGSAVQNGQRLILVINGLKTARDRASEAQKILSWGFRSFEQRTLFEAGDPIGTASVYGGARSSVSLVAVKDAKLLVPRGSGDRLSGKIVYTGPLPAPVEPGIEIAHLKIARGDREIFDLPLKTGEAVPVGTLQQRAWDAGVEYVGTLVRQHLRQ